MRSYARYNRRYRRRISISNRIRSTVLSLAEPKMKDITIAKTNMAHNAIAYHQLNYSTNMPVQGQTDSTRIGDQIYTTGYLVRIVVGQFADRPNVTFKWWIFGVPKGTAYAYNSWFVNTTGNVLLDNPNLDWVKVYKSGTWKNPEGAMIITTASGTQTVEQTMVKKVWVPYKKLVKFGPADAVTTTTDQDLYFVITCWDAYGTLATDNIAYYQGHTTLYFRDP